MYVLFPAEEIVLGSNRRQQEFERQRSSLCRYHRQLYEQQLYEQQLYEQQLQASHTTQDQILDALARGK